MRDWGALLALVRVVWLCVKSQVNSHSVHRKKLAGDAAPGSNLQRWIVASQKNLRFHMDDAQSRSPLTWVCHLMARWNPQRLEGGGWRESSPTGGRDRKDWGRQGCSWVGRMEAAMGGGCRQSAREGQATGLSCLQMSRQVDRAEFSNTSNTQDWLKDFFDSTASS